MWRVYKAYSYSTPNLINAVEFNLYIFLISNILKYCYTKIKKGELMLTLLTSVITVIFVFFGYCIMAKLDRFLEKIRYMIEKDKGCSVAIIFGRLNLQSSLTLF